MPLNGGEARTSLSQQWISNQMTVATRHYWRTHAF